MLYRVKDLSPAQRHAAEVLLGHPVSDRETLSIKSLDPATVIPRPSPAARIAALAALEKRFASRTVAEVGPEEENALVDEAVRAIRSEPRPVR